MAKRIGKTRNAIPGRTTRERRSRLTLTDHPDHLRQQQPGRVSESHPEGRPGGDHRGIVGSAWRDAFQRPVRATARNRVAFQTGCPDHDTGAYEVSTELTDLNG